LRTTKTPGGQDRKCSCQSDPKESGHDDRSSDICSDDHATQPPTFIALS